MDARRYLPAWAEAGRAVRFTRGLYGPPYPCPIRPIVPSRDRRHPRLGTTGRSDTPLGGDEAP
jgi:hypothetical protein